VTKNKETAMEHSANLRHIVLCAFQEGTPAERLALIIREFSLLEEKIEQVRHFECGVNNSPENLNDGLTHCFALSFDNEKERDAYLAHPAHLAFVELLKPCLAKVLVVDYFAGKDV
jgi:hypothetical protein